MSDFLNSYRAHVAERQQQGVVAKPLDAETDGAVS